MLIRANDNHSEVLIHVCIQFCNRCQRSIGFSRTGCHVKDTDIVLLCPCFNRIYLIRSHMNMRRNHRARQYRTIINQSNVVPKLLDIETCINSVINSVATHNLLAYVWKVHDFDAGFIIFPHGVKRRLFDIYTVSILRPRSKYINRLVIGGKSICAFIHRSGKCYDIPIVIVHQPQFFMEHSNGVVVLQKSNLYVQATGCNQIT